ncbi:probable WRKY transcription factor 29 [Prosopis cineraria]|uniref:probable WRKY transcription factor 29 n=1 Tax=Prosopis cineraria TaxID=364024 RepID=UPI0024108301|nr:probable WRKY transcription factor 29 [Prosopis cineraria]
MDELARLMDWDLQAIVRGFTGEAPETTTIIDIAQPNFPHFCSELQGCHDDPFCSTFPEFSDTTMVFDELGEFYKPFYPVLHPLSTKAIATTSVSIPKEIKESEKVQDLQDPAVSQCKRSKKNQNKRVVKQVKADGLCDSWAWRKYGQKPIKGSPYPRSYYRCSSSKGCMARKQVERSHLDPEVFIVTYTAQHSDHHPPRSSRKTRHSIPHGTNHQHVSSDPLEDSVEDEPIVSSGSSQCLNKDQLTSQDAETGEIFTGHGIPPASNDWFPSVDELDGLSQEFALDSYLHGQF